MSHEFAGYECAEVTLAGVAAFFRHPNAEAIPVALTGWINPLLLLYLLSCAARRLNRVRPFLAGAIVVCCLAMWIELAAEHVALLAGHYLWIAGIVLILTAPLANQVSESLLKRKPA